MQEREGAHSIVFKANQTRLIMKTYTKKELTNHIDQLIRTASSEGAKATIDHLLDLRNLIKPQTK